MAVNMLAAMPMIRVTAKPLMGPVPNWNRKTAEMTVVRLESKIVQNAFLKPASMADLGDLPRLSSSRMRSKISTLASTAMPMDRMMPAMPGMDRVALK